MYKIELKNEAILYILDKQSGYIKDLIAIFGEELVNELGRLGYITQGATLIEDNSFKRTWVKTKKAENYSQFFILAPSDREKESGRYLHSLGY